MEKRFTAGNELIFHAPGLIKEALAHPNDKETSEKAIVEETFVRIPTRDEDRQGWLNLLRLACLGYFSRHKLESGEAGIEFVIREVQEQMEGGGYKDWLSAWNTIRWIPGQAEREAKELTEYKSKYQKGEEFPWFHLIFGLIIMLVRLDHPEYRRLSF